MSSGFKQMLTGDKLTTRAVTAVSQALCLTQGALTWHLALPSS